MFDFSKLMEAYTFMRDAPPDQSGRITTMFVFTAIAYMVYYIMAGIVVLSLGRRLIQASFAAYKESRRERT